jgi:creatinine amidohydrolase
MLARVRSANILAAVLAAGALQAQTNPLWHEEKIRNYLPHMTWPEVEELLGRTDVAIVPVASLEQHGPQTPIGTDYFVAVEKAKLVAQTTDALVAPVLMPGISPYHMEFPGTITLSHETVQQVLFEAAQSLIRHGIRRILFLNGHMGDQYVTAYVADRINQETQAISLELGAAVAPLLRSAGAAPATAFDRHAGVGETSEAMYLIPNLVELSKAGKNDVTLPGHLNRALPQVIAGDAVTTQVFLAEALKPKETGKHTSTREMTATGVWSQRDTREASAAQGRATTEAFVNAAVAFIDKWKSIRPVPPLAERR